MINIVKFLAKDFHLYRCRLWLSQPWWHSGSRWLHSLYGIGVWDAIVAPEAPIREQFYHEIDFMHRKWPVQKYLGLFSKFTNTYAPLEAKDRYEQAINEPGVVGINIGTVWRLFCQEMWLIIWQNSRTYACDRRTWLANDFMKKRQSSHKLGTQLWTLCGDGCVSVRQRLRLYRIWINGLPGKPTRWWWENVRRCDGQWSGELNSTLLHLMINTRMQRDHTRRAHENGTKTRCA